MKLLLREFWFQGLIGIIVPMINSKKDTEYANLLIFIESDFINFYIKDFRQILIELNIFKQNLRIINHGLMIILRI